MLPRRSLCAPWLFGIAATIVLGFLGGCAEGPRDSGGRVMDMSKPLRIDPEESRFNTYALLENVDKYGLSRIIRDNGDIYIESKRSGILNLYIQHSTEAWFGEDTFEKYTSTERLRDIYSIEEAYDATPVSGHSRTTRGVLFSTSNCHRLFFVKRLKSQTFWDNDHYDADTAIALKLCGRENFDAVAFMKNFDLMSQSDLAVVRTRYSDSN